MALGCMKVLIAPDKFKGTLTARQAAQAMARGWRQVRPGDDVELLPMSDGGDGFGEVMGRRVAGAPEGRHQPPIAPIAPP